MIDFALDQETNDLIFKNFDFFLFDDTNQIMQNLAIRLRFVLGEWFLDITQGVPYFEVFFKKSPNQIQIESILKQEIVNTRGIIELTAFESSFDQAKRIYYVKFSAKSIFGENLIKEMELPA